MSGYLFILKTKNFFWPNFKFVPWGPKGSGTICPIGHFKVSKEAARQAGFNGAHHFGVQCPSGGGNWNQKDYLTVFLTFLYLDLNISITIGLIWHWKVPKEASWWARFNGTHNFRVKCPSGGENWYQMPKNADFRTFLDFDTKPDFEFFVLLETSLAFEKAVNLPYWKAKLNVRIFVYIENKKNFFWPNFKFVLWETKGSFQRVHRAPSREPEVIPLLWGHKPQSRGPAGPPSPPQELEGRARSALNF